MRFKDPEAAALYFRNKPGTAHERLTLAEHGFSLRFSDPAAMRAWCDAALVGLPPETDAQTAGHLHGYAANAHRVVGEFKSAKKLLEKALALCPRDPRLLEFKASLLFDRRRLKAANAALSQAAALRCRKKEPLPHTSILLQTALVLNQSEKPDDAAAVALGAIKVLAETEASAEGVQIVMMVSSAVSSIFTGCFGRFSSKPEVSCPSSPGAETGMLQDSKRFLRPAFVK